MMFFLAILLIPFSIANAMSKPTLVYTIAGQNGLGSSCEYVKQVLSINDDAIIPVATPSSPDLGQNKCIDLLKKTIADNSAQKAIIHATSQGTATALNYLAHYDDKSIAALILEAPLSSGNNAIIHTLKGSLVNNPSLATLAQTYGSYYWIPYGAKLLQFPSYWPAGKQAIKSAHKISADLPIILVHAKNDPQIAYTDTLALYYALRASGHKNIYLISKQGSRHINLLTSEHDKNAVRIIVDLHTHYWENRTDTCMIDIPTYKPDHNQYKHFYDELIAKEKNHERMVVASGITLAAGLAIAAKTYLPDIPL